MRGARERGGEFVSALRRPRIAQAGTTAAKLSATNFSIIDNPAHGTYPLANFSWTLLYQKQASTAKGEALASAFHLRGDHGPVPGGRARVRAPAGQCGGAWPKRR